MGDVSAEPSMEDILSSIKRIIAEEDAPAVRPRRSPPATTMQTPHGAIDDDEDRGDEVLELNDRVGSFANVGQSEATRSDEAPPVTAEPIVSDSTAQVTRGALDALSRLMVKPEAPSDGTLEGLVREMLRPILREWLDANLPAMVEAMVAREIAKITGTH